MATAWRMPEFQPTNALLNFAPLNQGLATLNQSLNQERSDQRADRTMAIQEGQFDLQKKKSEQDAKTQEVQRIGRMAQVIDQEKDPAKRTDLLNRVYTGMPEIKDALVKHGIDPADVARVPKFLMAEAGAYDPQGDRKSAAELARIQSQTGLANAQAQYYRNRAPVPLQTPAAPAQDPLANAGLDDEGRIVIPGASSAPSQGGVAVPDYVPSVPRGTVSGPGTMVVPSTGGPNFGGRMNLGGPVDDIDRSMRLDEGRPQGVQVAQAGGAVPSVPGVRPELMGQAMSRFGRTGMTSPDVPGMVTDAGRNRRVDVTATREMQGQRAFNQVTPEQQDRLMKFRQDQELWTGMHKRPPSAGYYYGPNGREISNREERGASGTQRAVQGALDNALSNINAAREAILGETESGQKVGDGTSYIGRAASALTGSGTFALSQRLLRPAVRSILHGMSGASVSIPETTEYLDTYMPAAGDSNDTIRFKLNHISGTLAAIRKVTANPEDKASLDLLQERMQAGLRAGLGLKPNATNADTRGAPQQSSGVRGMTNDELINRVFGR